MGSRKSWKSDGSIPSRPVKLLSELLWRDVFIMPELLDKIAGSGKARLLGNFRDIQVCRMQKLLRLCDPHIIYILGKGFSDGGLEILRKIAVAHAAEPGYGFCRDVVLIIFVKVVKNLLQPLDIAFLERVIDIQVQALFLPAAQDPQENAANMGPDGQLKTVAFLPVFMKNFLEQRGDGGILELMAGEELLMRGFGHGKGQHVFGLKDGL